MMIECIMWLNVVGVIALVVMGIGLIVGLICLIHTYIVSPVRGLFRDIRDIKGEIEYRGDSLRDRYRNIKYELDQVEPHIAASKEELKDLIKNRFDYIQELIVYRFNLLNEDKECPEKEKESPAPVRKKTVNRKKTSPKKK